jgi:hypothetical protein
MCQALTFFAVDRIRGNCGSVFVPSSKLCCVDARKSGSLKKLDVLVPPNPECWVGFESLGGGEGDVTFLGLWLRLRESSLIARAFPSLVGGEDCIVVL